MKVRKRLGTRLQAKKMNDEVLRGIMGMIKWESRRGGGKAKAVNWGVQEDKEMEVRIEVGTTEAKVGRSGEGE